MMKKILCLTLLLTLCAVLPALAEAPQPVTAEELGARLESARTEALASEPLNDPADPEAQSEDGTVFRYETLQILAEGTALAADTPVNTLVFDESEGPVFRGIGIYSTADDVFAAFPNENPEQAGTREGAVLYLNTTEAGGFVYGRILRDGQRISVIEYGELLPAGDGFHYTTVTFSMQDGLVASIRVDGLNPEAVPVEAAWANDFYAELEKLAGRNEYRAVRSSRDGKDLTPFEESDLTFSGISYVGLQPGDLPDETDQEMIDNEDGTWLKICAAKSYEAVFLCDAEGQNAEVLSFTIRDDGLEGPRCVRLGDQLSEDLNRFRHSENEVGEDMTEILYGTEGTAPWGFASYDATAGEMSLHYVTDTQNGRQVELLLRYVDNYLTEIVLQTL